MPFFLAAGRPAAALARPGAGRRRRVERLAALWEGLGPLEEAAWRGELSGHGLARLQRLRVEYAALFHRGRA